MMMMHHHRLKVDGHSDCLIVVWLEHRAHPSTEEVRAFHGALICHYQSSIQPIRRQQPPRLHFCDAKMSMVNLLANLSLPEAKAPLKPKLCRHFKYLCCRTRAELSNEPLDAIWVWFKVVGDTLYEAHQKDLTTPGILLNASVAGCEDFCTQISTTYPSFG